MAHVKGGRLTEVRINGRNYDPTRESSPTFKVATKEYESEMTAGRNLHTIVKEAMGGFSDLELSVTDAEYDILKEISDAGELVEVTITRATGATYGGLCMFSSAVELSDDGKVTLEMHSADFMRIN